VLQFDRQHTLCACYKAASDERCLVVARYESQSHADSFLSVAIALFYQLGRSFLEQRYDVLVYLFKFFKYPAGRSSDHILWLGHTDSLQLYSCLILDILD
jgi:hypothetical protein